MTPAGYMAKYIVRRPDSLGAANVADVYSLSGCISEDFADYVQHWKHNGYWLFDSPQIIRTVAGEGGAELRDARLFYYEVHESEFDGQQWRPFLPNPSFETKVQLPASKVLEGFDVVTFSANNSPECSPLSCNSKAEEIHTNSHCLLESFDDAKQALEEGRFNHCERGPYRIFAVYSVDCYGSSEMTISHTW
jgi:hypothetical protein